jgi:hypothetical protein
MVHPTPKIYDRMVVLPIIIDTKYSIYLKHKNGQNSKNKIVTQIEDT